MSKLYLSLFIFLVLLACKSERDQTEPVQADPGLRKYNELVTAFPKNDTLYYERAAYLYEQQNYRAAIRDLNVAIDLNPKMEVYYNLLSDTYFDLEEFDESITVLGQLIKMNPDTTPLLLKLCEVQWIAGKNQDALSTVDRIHSVDPEESEAYYMKGLIQISLEEKDAALESLLRSLELNPINVDALLLVGHIYEDLKDPEALFYYGLARKLAPESAEVLNAIGLHLMRSQQYMEALEYYKEVILKNKYNTEALLNSGIIYLQYDSLDQALNHFDMVTSIEVDESAGYYYRGLTKKIMGDTLAAIEDFDKALYFKPDWDEPKEELERLKPN